MVSNLDRDPIDYKFKISIKLTACYDPIRYSKSEKKLRRFIVLLLIVGAVCSPELVEGSTAIYLVWLILINEVSCKGLTKE